MWDSDPDSGNLNNGDFGHEWNYSYAGKISIDSDSDVFSVEPGSDFVLGEVSGYTEAKLKTILTEIEACPDTTSQCSMSVSDLTAAKEGFN